MDVLKQALNFVLNKIDNGDFMKVPMKWYYVLKAVIPLLIPFAVLYVVIYYFSDLKHLLGIYNAWDQFVSYIFILLVIAVLFALAYISFLFWMNRRRRLDTIVKTGDDIVAIPLIANLIQCNGEWLGLYVAILPSLSAVCLYLYLLLTGANNFYDDGNFLIGLLCVIGVIALSALLSYFIITFFHFIAERLRLLPQIANDVRDMGDIHRAATFGDAPNGPTVNDPEASDTNYNPQQELPPLTEL